LNYLTQDEQFKKILNNLEIQRIEDQELRDLRMGYWIKRVAAWDDERRISDNELGKVWDRLFAEEAAKIEAYKARKNI